MIDIDVRDMLFCKYDEYVATFEINGVLDAMSQLKVEHSKRVAENARLIAGYNGFSKSMVVLAEVCGLLHDIGRYRQLKKYGTFKDIESINHGECGYEVLLELGWLDVLPEKSKYSVLISTRYHNAKSLPEDIEDETFLTFLKLVRDSDKLDIYYVFYDALKNGHLKKYPEIVHNLDLDVPAAEKIVDSILKDPHVPISYNEAKSMADFLLIPVQWSYDLHSFGSYKILVERGLLAHMKEIMPNIHDEKIAKIIDNAIINAQCSLERHL